MRIPRPEARVLSFLRKSGLGRRPPSWHSEEPLRLLCHSERSEESALVIVTEAPFKVGTGSATKNLLRSNRLILTRADPSLRSESCPEPGGTSRTARSRSFAVLRMTGERAKG